MTKVFKNRIVVKPGSTIEPRKEEGGSSVLDGEAPSGSLFPKAGGQQPVGPKGGGPSWLSLQGEAGRKVAIKKRPVGEEAPSKRAINNYLKVILQKGHYRREKQLASTPRSIRQHPDFLLPLFGEESSLADWLDDTERNILKSLLSDPKNLAKLEGKLLERWELLPPKLIDDPTVQDDLFAEFQDKPDWFRSLPIQLRAQERCIELALKKRSHFLNDVPFELLEPTYRQKLEAEILEGLEERPYFNDVPAGLQTDARFLTEAVQRCPRIWLDMSDEARAILPQIFANNPELLARMVETTKEWFEASYERRKPERWQEIPVEVRSDPSFLRSAIAEKKEVIEYAGLTPEGLGALFSDKAAIEEISTYRFCSIVSQMDPQSLRKKAVIDRVMEGVVEHREGYQELPAQLKRHPRVIQTMVEHHPLILAKEGVDDLPPPLRNRLEGGVIRDLKKSYGGLKWESVPESLRTTSFAKRMLRSAPDSSVPDAIALQIEEIYEEPRFRAKAMKHWLDKNLDAFPYRKDNWQRTPPLIRRQREFIRAMVQESHEYVALATLPKEQAEVEAALCDVDFLLQPDVSLIYLAPHIPERILQQDAVISALCEQIAESSYGVEDLPKVLKTNHRVIEALLARGTHLVQHLAVPERGSENYELIRDAWIDRAVRDEKCKNWGEIPAELKTDEAFLASCLTGNSRYLSVFSEEQIRSAQTAFDDPSFQEHINEWSFFGDLQRVPEDLHQHEGLRQQVISFFAESTYGCYKAPATILANEDVALALLEQDPEEYTSLPWDLVSDPVKEKIRQVAPQEVAKNLRSWEKLPDEIRRDPAFVCAALRASPNLTKYFDEEDFELAAAVLADTGFLKRTEQLLELLPYVTDTTRQKPAFIEILAGHITEHPRDYRRLPSDLKLVPEAVVAYIEDAHYVDRDEVPPEALTPAVQMAIIQGERPAALSIGREQIDDAVAAFAKERALATITDESKMTGLPRFLWDDLDIKLAFLNANGLEAFDHGSRDLIHDAALWERASLDQARAYAEAYPDRFALLPEKARADPKIAMSVIEAVNKESLLDDFPKSLWARKTFVRKMMEKFPTAYMRAADEVKVALAQEATQAHPANLEVAPLSKTERKRILQSFRMTRPGLRRENPWDQEATLSAGRYRSSHERMDLASPPLAIAYAARYPEQASIIPRIHLRDPSFLGALLEAVPAALEHLDFEEEEVPEAITQVLIEQTKKNPALFEHLPSTLLNNRDLVDAIVDQHPSVMLHVGADLKRDLPLWTRALKQNALLATSALTETAKPFLLEQIASKQVAPAEIPRGLCSSEAVSACIATWGGHGLETFSKWLGEDGVRAAVLDLITNEPERAADGIESIPRELQLLLRSVPSDSAVRFALAAVDLKPYLYSWLPPNLQRNPEVRSLHQALNPKPEDILDIHDPETRLLAIRREPSALKLLPPNQRTRELCLAAVALDGSLINDVPKHLLSDPDIALAAVSSYGEALELVDDDLKATYEIVAAAVVSKPEAIRFARLEGEELKSAQLLAVRHGGLIDEIKEHLMEKDFVLAFADHIANFDYSGGTSLRDEVYRYEHHLDDPSFVDLLLDRRPELLKHLPEEHWTPQRVLQAATKAHAFWDFRGEVDPRLDLRKLPIDTWPELARANPRHFLSSFTELKVPAKDQPKLQKAVLAALNQEADAIDRIPESWWNDPEFMAKAITANPLIWKNFGPLRRQWLASFHEEATRDAERFLEQLDTSGISLSKFPGRFPVVQQLVNNRFNASADDTRPIAFISHPVHDRNGAFKKAHFDELLQNYRVMYYEVGSVDQLGESLRQATEPGPAEVVIFCAHGSPESLALGPKSKRPDVRPNLRPEHIHELAQLCPADRIAPHCKVVFDACSVGGGGKARRNLANNLGQEWPQAWIQAAWLDSSSGNRLKMHEDGEFNRFDFRFYDTNRPVPYYVVAPTAQADVAVAGRRSEGFVL